MLKRKLTHLEAHAIAHRLRQAGEVVAGVVEELVGMDASPSRECGETKPAGPVDQAVYQAIADNYAHELEHECGGRQLSEEQREALEYALYALRQMTSIQSDDAREVISALLSKGE